MNKYLTLRDIVLSSGRGIGLCCIVITAVGCIVIYSRMIHRRLKEVRELLAILRLFRSELSYQCELLPVAMIQCGEQVGGVCGGWFAETGRRILKLEGERFSVIWEEQVAVMHDISLLPSGVIDELKRLGIHLAEPDKQIQLGALQTAYSSVAETERRLSRKMPEQLRLYTSLFVLAAAFIIIILI